MSLILVRNESGDDYVSIDFVARLFPNSELSWDKNLLDGPTVVHVGGFVGQIPARFHTWDLRTFRVQLFHLYENIDGEALLSTVEGWLSLKFVGDGLGHISVGGAATERMGIGNRLSFDFDMDQTFLPDILSSVDAVNANC